MVSVPSLSGEEHECVALLEEYLTSQGVKTERAKNNIICKIGSGNGERPVLLLNSHIDTVKPSSSYTFDPFNAPISSTTVYGLGSNDAGASVVSLISAFIWLKERYCIASVIGDGACGNNELPFDITLILSAEEENSGENGMSLALKKAGRVDAAIVGEPTQMKCAIAERGLLVLDCIAHGITGHAARDEGTNAIYIAHDDISVLRSFRFEEVSPLMGEIKITVTQIEAGIQHNVIPDSCRFVVDIRPTDVISNKAIVDKLRSVLRSEIKPRSLLNSSSATPQEHPLYRNAIACRFETFVSPTTSDWMRLPVPAIKMGPGDSARSHNADEYVLIEEIKRGIEGYIRYIENLRL